MSDIEKKIIENIIYHEEYARKIIPFIEIEYFTDAKYKILIDEICNFFSKFNALPDVEILSIELQNKKNISEDEFKSSVKLLKTLEKTEINLDWLIKKTESFFKDRAVYNAIVRSLSIINKEDKVYAPDAIPKILQDALAVSFDKNVGHNYFDDAESRFDFYHRREDKIPFDIELLNKITDGGLSRKSLTIFLAMTGLGKTLVMCHLASSIISQGKNVLYITLEMAEERIAERIDANLLNIDIKDLKALSKDSFSKRIDRVKEKSNGKLVIKEYPTSSAHVGHFRILLEELKTKKNFMPDVIIVDYLGICASSRIKAASGANSYLIVKSIAEELRGLSMEYNVPIISGAQTSKRAYESSDISLSDVSESYGLNSTADLILGLVRTEELDKLNQILVTQLKNRYSDLSTNKRFVIGVDRSKMKLYNIESMGQNNISDSNADINDISVSRKKHKDFSGLKI